MGPKTRRGAEGEWVIFPPKWGGKSFCKKGEEGVLKGGGESFCYFKPFGGPPNRMKGGKKWGNFFWEVFFV